MIFVVLERKRFILRPLSERKMFELDNLDRKILYYLDLNSRQSVSDLSRRLKHGRDRIHYRIERLIKEEIIKKFSIFSLNLNGAAQQ